MSARSGARPAASAAPAHLTNTIPAFIDDPRPRAELSGTCRFVRFPEADGHVDTPGELDGNLRLPKATLRGCAGVAARPRPFACADMAVPA